MFWQLIERRAKHDWVRTVRMTAMGGLVVGPTLRTWYLCLDKVCVTCTFTGLTPAFTLVPLETAKMICCRVSLPFCRNTWTVFLFVCLKLP